MILIPLIISSELAPEIETDLFTVVTCVLHLLTVFFHITTFYWMFIEGRNLIMVTCNRGRAALIFLLIVTNCCFDLLTVFAEPALHRRPSDAGRIAALFLLHHAEIGIIYVWCMDIEIILSQ